MPWITVEEPFAKPPRVAPNAEYPEFSGPFTIDRGWAELEGVAVTGGSQPAFDDLQELEVRDSSLNGVIFSEGERGGAQPPVVELYRSQLENCDLSGVSVRSLRGCRIAGSKLIGTDFSGGAVADVVFERCMFRYANLRMTKLSRVEFVDCTFDDVDCYQMEATDVTFPGSALSAVGLDGLSATNFDLREAKEIALSTVNRLDGCLVAEHQLIGLAHSLAMAAGVQVERQVDSAGTDH